MSTITTNDILLQMNDHLANYQTGTVDLGNRMRGLNRAIEYVQRRLTLPSDKQIFKFNFSQDTFLYTLPTDFNEPLQVLYQNTKYNINAHSWDFRPDDELLTIQGNQFGNYWSFTSINGFWQLMMLGANLAQGSVLATFDATTGFVAQNDAENLRSDTNVKQEGSASLAFDIDPTFGHARGSVYWPVNWDVTAQHTNNAYYKLYAFLPVTTLTSINFVFGSSPTDYYSFSTTMNDDGTAWTANAWNLISWNWLQPPTIVGSPNDQAINFARMDFMESGAFVTESEGFRIDKLYFTVPDAMELIYLTQYKGTNASGSTKKIMLTASDDIPSFQTFVPDLLGPIALRGAYLISSQLRADEGFMAMYKEDCEETLKLWSRSYPRRRQTNFGRTVIQRP